MLYIIGTNIRNWEDTIQFLSENGGSGVVLALDYAAAFDSVNREFLYMVMDTCNFGENYFNWIKTLYDTPQTCVLNNCFSTGWFPLERGLRQGCPSSPLLFLLENEDEKLASHIHMNKNIKGVRLGRQELKISQFADGTTLILKDESSILESFSTIDRFSAVSGLRLNLSNLKIFR